MNSSVNQTIRSSKVPNTSNSFGISSYANPNLLKNILLRIFASAITFL